MKIKPSLLCRTGFFFFLFTITVLALVIICRTILIHQQMINSYCLQRSIDQENQIEDSNRHKPITADRGVFERFQQALRFRTITRSPKNYSRNETLQFIQFLKYSFPRVHSSPLVSLQVINGFSLLYKVTGSSNSLKPYLLLAHMDVVPAQERMWKVPPFDGVILDEEIYGRGALDHKLGVMGIMEALEFLLESEAAIERSFFIAFGHDEEGRGLDGAREISKHMKQNNLDDVEFILDEGIYILDGKMPGISQRVAMIGVAEKGFLNIRLTVNGSVGHSSMPPPETAIVKMAKAVAKLNSHSHPNMFGKGPERDLIEALAPHSSLFYRMLYTNLWLFSPLVAKILEADNMMNGLIRTTTAVTIFHSGVKDNILPGEAEVTVNHRIYPLDNVKNVLNYDVALIADKDIEVQVLGTAIEPHPISPYTKDCFGYQTVRLSIQQVFPDVAIIPGVMTASTDTRWYLNFTRNIYRFTPGHPKDLSIVHGHNERITKDNYLKAVNFYHHIMINANKAQLDTVHFKDEF